MLNQITKTYTSVSIDQDINGVVPNSSPLFMVAFVGAMDSYDDMIV